MSIGASLFLLMWVVCGALNYGATFAYFQRTFILVARKKRVADTLLAVVMALGGPLASPAVWLLTEHFKHGLQFRSGGQGYGR